MLHGGGIKWKDDGQAKAEQYKLGTATGEAIREALEDRDRERRQVHDQDRTGRQGILYIEDG